MEAHLLLESIVVAVVLGGTLLWLATQLPRRPWRLPVVGLTVGVVCSFAVARAFLYEPPLREEEIVNRPIQVAADGYVTSESCRACHPSEYESWHDSYHRRMTQVANSDSVVGNFNDVRLSYHGQGYRLFQQDGGFWFEIESSSPSRGKSEEPARRPIVLTTGSHHMQAYWYPVGVGRAVEFFPFIFLIPERRWVPRESVFLQPTVPADAPLAPITEQEKWQRQRHWNHNCMHCHTTEPQPYFPAIDTRVAEFGIACEACHGEGKEHIEANRSPWRRYRLHIADEGDDSIVEPSSLDAKLASQVCGQCHSINYPSPEEWQHKLETGSTFRPGDRLEKTQVVCQASRGSRWLEQCGNPTLEYQFWPDGMLRVSGREYIGLLDSPCYRHGDMTCLSCHELHQKDPARSSEEWADDQLGAGLRGNEACLQCHQALRAPEQIVDHTRHPIDSSGSECMNCHMSYTSYGLLKAIRSHEISSPSVAVSLETGRPNACNQCHLDRSLKWTSRHLEADFGQASPELDVVERSVPASLIWLLSGDAGQRALMAWSFGWQPAIEVSGSGWLAPPLAQLLADPYDAVRLVAFRSLSRQKAFEDFDYDYLAPPSELADAVRRAYAIWLSLPPEQKRDPYTLIDEDGETELPPNVLTVLRSQRDDRTVILTE